MYASRTEEFFDKYRGLYLQIKEAVDNLVKKDAAIKKDFEAKAVNTVDFKNVGNFFKKNGKLVKKALTNCVSMIKITLIKMILVFEKLIFVRSDFLVEKSGKLNFRF